MSIVVETGQVALLFRFFQERRTRVKADLKNYIQLFGKVFYCKHTKWRCIVVCTYCNDMAFAAAAAVN